MFLFFLRHNFPFNTLFLCASPVPVRLLFTSASFGRNGLLFSSHGTVMFFYVVLDFHIAFYETMPCYFEICHSYVIITASPALDVGMAKPVILMGTWLCACVDRDS